MQKAAGKIGADAISGYLGQPPPAVQKRSFARPLSTSTLHA